MPREASVPRRRRLEQSGSRRDGWRATATGCDRETARKGRYEFRWGLVVEERENTIGREKGATEERNGPGRGATRRGGWWMSGKVREGVVESRSAREKEQMCVDCGGVRSPS